MDKRSFIDLLDRYQQDNCSEAEKMLVEQWYASLENKRSTSLSDQELSEISRRMETAVFAHAHPKKSIHRKLYVRISVAAAVALIAVTGSLFIFSGNQAEHAFIKDHQELAMLTETNSTANVQIVELSDHSVVTLQPKASITYPKIFNGSDRPVYLKGDAFFAVSKNPKKPFYVYNNNLVVKVLGTSFFVKESANGKTAQVDVNTGKVQVDENENRSLFSVIISHHAKTVHITANQKAVFNDRDQQLTKSLVDQPLTCAARVMRAEIHAPNQAAEVVPLNSNYKFAETTLKDIFKILSYEYNIKINVADESTNGCTFTGDISNKGLYEQLSLICQSVSGSYQIDGTSILVKGIKCH
ncbi:MAG: FecR family protein [Pedobacter sp.]|nr:MAG: FecR family protein [Pedobacter sp.]